MDWYLYVSVELNIKVLGGEDREQLAHRQGVSPAPSLTLCVTVLPGRGTVSCEAYTMVAFQEVMRKTKS